MIRVGLRGQLSIRQTPVVIGNVIRNACEEVQPLIDRHGHRLTVGLHDAPITLLGDESRLIQVLANLLQNSAKFTDRNGNLHIECEQDKDQAVIRVCDNGRGISADALRNIFLPNRSPRDRPTVKADGLGIGLRLAKTIVELHGGTIGAFSDGLGAGSTFWVKLPIVTDVGTGQILDPPQTGAPDQEICRQLPHYRILVVDDDRSMRFLMSRMLQKIDQSVTVTGNGDTAIRLILQERPQVVFLDLQLDGMSGFDIARQLRDRGELDGLVLIALSGNADRASRELASESGFDRYLVKPTSIDVLTETLRGVSQAIGYRRTIAMRERISDSLE